MEYLPIFMRLRDRQCLVVGGGEVAARKISLLLSAGGVVCVVAPQLVDTCARLVREGRIAHQSRRFAPEDIEGAAVVVAATDDTAVNRAVSVAATARCIPVNVVDNPELCTFIMPAIVDRSPVLIGVSTGGSSPVLARLLRTRLESLVPPAYGRLAAFAERFRGLVKTRVKEPVARRAFWEEALSGPVAEQIFAGDDEAAERLMHAQLAPDVHRGSVGEVYYVATGPGEPDLLPCRALRLMQQAEVVVSDAGVPEVIVGLSRRDARRIEVGRDGALRDDAAALLVDLAKEGNRIARLRLQHPGALGTAGRGGDSEVDALKAAQVPVHIVPAVEC